MPLASLEALQLHLESVLKSVPDAMIVMEDTGTIIAFSDAAVKMFGYSAKEAIGQDVKLLMTGRDREDHGEYLARYLRTGERRIIGLGRVVTARSADGKTFPVDLKIGEARIGDHHVFTAFIRDLTETQQTELRMREMQAELVHFSRLSAVGTMAAALAHELNQPLTAVANYLEAGRDLLDSPDAETIAMVQEALDEAAKQSVRAGQIVRKLRDYVARGHVETQVVDLEPVIADAIYLARIGNGSENVRIDFERANANMKVDIDPIQIQQVVINLFRNAFEAISGREDATVKIGFDPPVDGFIRARVADNGPGFEEEVARQLFRPFTSSKADGMGLGLSICQTIIEAHGGTIRANSSSKGAVFEFTLPLPGKDKHDD